MSLLKLAGPVDFVKHLSGHHVRKLEDIAKRMALDPDTANLPYQEYARIYDKNRGAHQLAIKKQIEAKEKAKMGATLAAIPIGIGTASAVGQSIANKANPPSEEAIEEARLEKLLDQRRQEREKQAETYLTGLKKMASLQEG